MIQAPNVASKRWGMLVVVYLAALSFAITLQSMPPVLRLILDEFQLSHTQGGLLMSLFALPGIVVSIPAGMLGDRYGQRILGIIAFLLMIAGSTIVAIGISFPILLLGRAISGAGALSLVVYIAANNCPVVCRP